MRNWNQIVKATTASNPGCHLEVAYLGSSFIWHARIHCYYCSLVESQLKQSHASILLIPYHKEGFYHPNALQTCLLPFIILLGFNSFCMLLLCTWKECNSPTFDPGQESYVELEGFLGAELGVLGWWDETYASLSWITLCSLSPIPHSQESIHFIFTFEFPHNQRKFRSLTSDNMDSWKAE